MSSALEVHDSQSNRPELIDDAAQLIGRSVLKLRLFEAIYKHKKRARSVIELAEMTKLNETRVLQLGGQLRADRLVDQVKIDGRVGYAQKPFYQHNKARILRLINKPSARGKTPTKRNVAVTVKIRAPKTTPARSAEFLTIDDIDSFSKVKKIFSTAKRLPASMSERQFNDGVKAIIGETGTFKDWGGETSDLFSTRLILNGKRKRVAFGFKGPGLKVALVPSRLGKNGDQMERLFSEPADVFMIQHWREIMPSVMRMMRLHADEKARQTGKSVYFGLIDGHDSNRLRLAYPSKFRLRKSKKT